MSILHPPPTTHYPPVDFPPDGNKHRVWTHFDGQRKIPFRQWAVGGGEWTKYGRSISDCIHFRNFKIQCQTHRKHKSITAQIKVDLIWWQSKHFIYLLVLRCLSRTPCFRLFAQQQGERWSFWKRILSLTNKTNLWHEMKRPNPICFEF